MCLCRLAGASAEAEEEEEASEGGVAESNCVYRLQETRLVPEEQAWASVPSVSLLGSSQVCLPSSHLRQQAFFFWFSHLRPGPAVRLRQRGLPVAGEGGPPRQEERRPPADSPGLGRRLRLQQLPGQSSGSHAVQSQHAAVSSLPGSIAYGCVYYSRDVIPLCRQHLLIFETHVHYGSSALINPKVAQRRICVVDVESEFYIQMLVWTCLQEGGGSASLGFARLCFGERGDGSVPGEVPGLAPRGCRPRRGCSAEPGRSGLYLGVTLATFVFFSTLPLPFRTVCPGPVLPVLPV